MSLRIEARKLLAAEQRCQEARGALEAAEREREKCRDRCRPLLAPGKLTLAGDVELMVAPACSPRTFRLAEYLRRHKLTKAMQPFVGEGTEYDRWTVKPAAA